MSLQVLFPPLREGPPARPEPVALVAASSTLSLTLPQLQITKMAASYKPSPLSYGSPRASPFRRPESPMSPSPLRQTTPTPSPTKTMATATTPSRLVTASIPTEEVETWTPRGLTPVARQREPSPTRGANASPSRGDMLTTARSAGDNSALSKLQPAQVRELRDGFQLLDRDSDGQVGRDDVADMLSQLGEWATSRFRDYSNVNQDCHPILQM